jgi:DNA-directed RNA polymerase subunit alpha
MLVIQRPTVEAIDEEEGNRQRFAISPLEPGFGHTLGNSLRRTLLSSIPGAAITQVRFDDALHEFDTITGVTEDVTDIILNLKDIVVLVDVRRARDPPPRRPWPGRGHRRRHPDHRRRRDPQPGLHVATLGERAASHSTSPSSAAVATCRDATGDARRHDRCHPVDAIFSPVRRVTFTGRADPRRAVDQLRPSRARHRDRRVHLAA